MNTYILALLFVICMLCKSVFSNQVQVDTGPLTCYECNVWKAGYGNLCDQPRIRTGCFACMKVETTIFMGYYKNTPRYSTVISRVCAKTQMVAYHTGCQYYDTVDGHSRRCYCNYSMCNRSERKATSIAVPTLLAVGALFIIMKNLRS